MSKPEATNSAAQQKPKGSAKVVVENRQTYFMSFNADLSLRDKHKTVVLPPATLHSIFRTVEPTSTEIDRDLWEECKTKSAGVRQALDQGIIREVRSTA